MPNDSLIAAVLAGDVDAAELALQNGAEPDLRRSYHVAGDHELLAGHESVLQCAVGRGCTPIVELLLQHGAMPDAADSLTGRTPLVDAAARGDVPLVAMLLAAGASARCDPQRPTRDAFAAAIAAGRIHAARRLADSGARATPRALENASHVGDLTLLELCVQLGACPRTTPCLAIAARMGHVDTMRTLCRHGAEISIEGEAALCEAANAGQVQAADWLIGEGVSLACRTSYGWPPPLHLAAYNAGATMVAALLAAGADVLALDSAECTALDWAIEAGKADNVALLRRAAAAR